MKTNKTSLLAVLIAFLAGALLGAGAIWLWQHYSFEKERREFAKLEKENALRTSMEMNYKNTFRLCDEYIKVKNAYDSTHQQRDANRLELFRSALGVYKMQHMSLEKILAPMEGRAPKELLLSFPPLPPSAIEAGQGTCSIPGGGTRKP